MSSNHQLDTTDQNEGLFEFAVSNEVPAEVPELVVGARSTTATSAPPRGGGSGSSNVNAGTSGYRRPSDRSLFVSGLHPDAEFTDLHKVFEKYGKIISCRVLKDAKTGLSRCIGYVNFSDPNDAQRAIEGEHGSAGPSGGGPMCVRYAEDDPAFVPEETKKLFVRYVPLDAQADDLRRVFGAYGQIAECNIMPDTSSAGRAEKELWNMAYVTFTTSDQATAACSGVHKTFALGPRHELHVKPAETLATRAMRQRKHEGSQSTAVSSRSTSVVTNSSVVSPVHSLNVQPAMVPMMPMSYPPVMMPGGAVPMMVPQPMAAPGYRVMYMPAPNGAMMPVMVPDANFAQVPMMMAGPAPTWGAPANPSAPVMFMPPTIPLMPQAMPADRPPQQF